MNPRTVATLKDLEAAIWFANVGKPRSADVRVLPSWKEAIASCSAVLWENLCLEAANQFRVRLCEKCPQGFSKWNDIVREVKGPVKMLVARKAEKVMTENALPKIFRDTVEWDILHLAMESEYADFHAPGFFASQAFWYKAAFPVDGTVSFRREGWLSTEDEKAQPPFCSGLRASAGLEFQRLLARSKRAGSSGKSGCHVRIVW